MKLPPPVIDGACQVRVMVEFEEVAVTPVGAVASVPGTIDVLVKIVFVLVPAAFCTFMRK